MVIWLINENSRETFGEELSRWHKLEIEPLLEKFEFTYTIYVYMTQIAVHVMWFWHLILDIHNTW